MINDFKIICLAKIEENKDNEIKQSRYKYIYNLLENDNAFLTITIEEAYAIFRDLGFERDRFSKLYEILIKGAN